VQERSEPSSTTNHMEERNYSGMAVEAGSSGRCSVVEANLGGKGRATHMQPTNKAFRGAYSPVSAADRPFTKVLLLTSVGHALYQTKMQKRYIENFPRVRQQRI